MKTYKAIYRDRFGEEKTLISNDGESLQMTIRGINFDGYSLTSFRPSGCSGCSISSLADRFFFHLGDLCSYELECYVPITLISNEGIATSDLQIYIKRGDQDPSLPFDGMVKENGQVIEDHQLDTDILKLRIQYNGEFYESDGRERYDTFDEQLTNLKDQLPAHVIMKICWSCQYADYLPTGSDQFGFLGCFKSTKEEYKQAKSKTDVFGLWKEKAGEVQEIHLCEEYERRVEGVGGLYIG